MRFDVVSKHYAGEVKNHKVPSQLWKWWQQIVDIAITHGKDPLIIWYPTNVPSKTIGVPKKVPPFHIISEERHEELLRKERIADGDDTVTYYYGGSINPSA